jgi:hypothetical protein
VLIAVIGANWLTSKDDQGDRRLDDPQDFVRMEIATALSRDIRVIPVLVDKALMPRPTDLPDNLKPLVRRNALQISGTSFDGDCQRLIATIKEILKAEAREHDEKERLEVQRRQKLEPARLETERIRGSKSEAEQQPPGYESKRNLWRQPLFIVALLVLISAVLALAIVNRDKLLFFLKPASTVIDLSGTWSCDDGASYTIQQEGHKISWVGENPPAFKNAFEGKIVDESLIEGTWNDFPGYRAFSKGTLTLKIESSRRLFRLSQTGGFGGSMWTKN